MRKLEPVMMVVLPIMVAAIILYIEDNALSETELTVQDDELPASFEGFRIVQLTDLHSKSFGKSQNRLVRKVRQQKPDLIVFTGDLIDQKRSQFKPGVTLLIELTSIAPVYYVTGNHEWWSRKAEALVSELTSRGVHVLQNESTTIQRGDEQIHLAGVDDPALEGSFEARLEEVSSNDFTILLSHRPEFLNLYQQHAFDLVFTGHAHGGQVRIPFVGGAVAPGQGFFPRYTAGKYEQGDTTMIVSRGLGNSIIPQRFFNRPEVVSITLE